MPDPKTLRVVAAVGRKGFKTILLAAHPDEQHLPTGDPSPNRRTLLLELAGTSARFVEEHPAPLSRAWMSANGTMYCSALETTQMHVSRGGRWTTEEFSPTPVAMVSDVFGFVGETDQEDIVFAAAPGKLFVRRDGQWTAHAAPNDMRLSSVHGRAPDEMYVGGEELLRFDGNAIEELDNPGHGVRAVWVTTDDRLLTGRDHLSISTTDGGWESIDAGTSENITGLADFEGEVYAGTFRDGVHKVYPGPATRSSPPFAVTRLTSIDGGLIAVHKKAVHVFDGTSWHAVAIPACEVGKRPK